jgi:secreted PhoX family phosphatase
MNEHVSSRNTVFRTSMLEAADGPPRNRTDNPTMGEIIAVRFSRRGLLKGALAASAISATVSPLALLAADRARAAAASAFSFTEAEAGVDETHHVAEGYDAKILLRWGDPLFPDSAEFDPMSQTAEKQRRQFGYNNDYIGFIPIEDSSDHGLLVVNHEYTNEHLMFPGIVSIVMVKADEDPEAKEEPTIEIAAATKERVDIEMAAHGGTIVELREANGTWEVVLDSPYNRRITADTEMELTGPAAGHARLKTTADPSGTKVLGMINNCAGGVTPWGTYVSGEENIQGYFTGELAAGHAEAVNHERMGVPEGVYAWGNFYDRFDVSKEPNEANRFGWIVEIDPLDATSSPKKRTALGRFKHEGAESIVAENGRVVVYLGDDERFDYVYKFVTSGTFNASDRAANMDLLDEGTLYVARFAEDGTVTWMPLVQGEGPLTVENGFETQADVVIEARRAGDLLGATKMDRPEDIQPNGANGKVYVMLTNNTRREPGQEDAANPRPKNAFGHIIEITEAGGDFTATSGTWEILLRCGDPSVAEVGATFSTATTENGWFGMPDNCAIDAQGRLWVATDGQGPAATGRTDGVWAVDTEGEARGTSKLFFRVPVGAELCGPLLTPDMETMFVAVQHPADGGTDWEEFGRPSYFEDLSTRWPDFQDGMPTRPSVVVITKQGGGKIAV